MANDMGGVTGHMTGRVIRGEDIERVLAAVPEQVWQYDTDVPSGVTNMSTIEFGTEIPMRVRRDIIAHVLAVIPD